MTNLYQYDDISALNGLSLNSDDLTLRLKSKKSEIESFVADLQDNVFPGFTIVNHTEDIAGLTLLVQNWQDYFEHAVFLGVGGSSLGAQTLVSFMGKYKQHKLKTYFLDNVDPFTFDDLMENLPLEKTVVIAVSKSGGTIETLTQTLLFADKFKLRKLPLSAHMLGITEDKASTLKDFFVENKIPTLNHSKEIGGRFTVLSLVGLLPALIAGVNVENIRLGAREVLDSFIKEPLLSKPAMGAAFSVIAGEKGKNIHYMMPYSDRLENMSKWYVQLWSESLGKEGKGTTPVPSLGSTDQHSALQMMMDGPKDKVVSIIIPNCKNDGEVVNSSLINVKGREYIEGLTLGKLIYNQAQGTADALNDNLVPVRVFYSESLNEKVLGALLMHFMLETAIAGILLEVNTWDQPGVEAGKARTVEYLKHSLNA